MNTFLVNQVNSVHRKSLTADKDKLLFVTGRGIRYFFFDAFLLGPGRIFEI